MSVPNYPSDFGSNQTAATYDFDEIYLLSSTVVLGSLLLLVVVFFSSEAQKTRLFMHASALFLVGFTVIAGLTGGEWSSDKISTRTLYRAGNSDSAISAYIGVRVSLNGFNVTLQGTPENQLGEIINYNEHFSWQWHQHYDENNKFGGQVNQDFRQSQLDGIPYPIQWVAHYFRLDGEKVRWGRFYRQAGYFTWLAMWFAFSLWVVAALMMMVQIAVSEIFLFATGVCCLFSVMLFFGIVSSSPLPLAIPLGDGTLIPKFGWVAGVVLGGGFCAMAPLAATCWGAYAKHHHWY